MHDYHTKPLFEFKLCALCACCFGILVSRTELNIVATQSFELLAARMCNLDLTNALEHADCESFGLYENETVRHEKPELLVARSKTVLGGLRDPKVHFLQNAFSQ